MADENGVAIHYIVAVYAAPDDDEIQVHDGRSEKERARDKKPTSVPPSPPPSPQDLASAEEVTVLSSRKALSEKAPSTADPPITVPGLGWDDKTTPKARRPKVK